MAAGLAGTVVRRCRREDAPAILAGMLAALARGECEGVERYQLEHAARRLARNPASCAVAEVDGELAGWVIPDDDELMVRPPYRRAGIGRRLVEAGRAIAAADGHDRLRLWVRRGPAPEAFASACGLRYTSSLWQLRLPDGIPAEHADPVFPAGTAIRSLRPGVDERALVALVNRVFLDHPSPLRLTEEEMRRVHDEPGADPASTLIVEEASAGGMVAFCRVVAYTGSDGAPSGEIRLLGVDRPWRGRGLGRAVTSWGIGELRRRGARDVMLVVEGENEIALRLYHDLGFRPAVEWRHWTLPT